MIKKTSREGQVLKVPHIDLQGKIVDLPVSPSPGGREHIV
jgi:hypothetical protein